ncbi:hypothetical protein G9A89_010254 [Geosiphon pyriformis]|nr:hypothetical protein G9A89_010254 [Geosiphon pyriformis]
MKQQKSYDKLKKYEERKSKVTIGYSTQPTGEIKRKNIVTPKDIQKIDLTSPNQKFLFHGTRNEILEWMLNHGDIIIDYNSIQEEIHSQNLSTSSEPKSFSKTGYITLDLYNPKVPEDSILICPINQARNHLPWMNMFLEIRPTNSVNDGKFKPVKRVILPSGLSLREISKALEIYWRHPQLKSPVFLEQPVETRIENSLTVKENNDVNSKTYHTTSIFSRWHHKDSYFSSKIITPYTFDSYNEEWNVKEEEQKREEKENLEQLNLAGLPNYDEVNKDQLLEVGDISENEKQAHKYFYQRLWGSNPNPNPNPNPYPD